MPVMVLLQALGSVASRIQNISNPAKKLRIEHAVLVSLNLATMQ